MLVILSSRKEVFTYQRVSFCTHRGEAKAGVLGTLSLGFELLQDYFEHKSLCLKIACWICWICWKLGRGSFTIYVLFSNLIIYRAVANSSLFTLHSSLRRRRWGDGWGSLLLQRYELASKLQSIFLLLFVCSLD